MADSTAAAGLTVQRWDDKFFVEHIQGNRFASEMGKSENNIIQVKEDLHGKKGKTVTLALVNRLTGSGVTGTSTLEGNEEDMDSRSFTVDVVKRRNAVRVAEQEEQYSAISLRNAAKSVLKTWATEDSRDRIIAALGSINGVAYGTANETQKDAWLVDNADRVLFGSAVGNNSSNDHSASLANIDNTNDKLTTGTASLMKRIARTANPKIRPIRSETDARYFYVMYVPSLVMRDLKADPVIQNAQRDVGIRMQNEKLFKGGDVEWDGIIFKEIEDIAVISGVGAAGIDVAPVYLCGAQAIAYATAKRWWSKDEVFDYGDKHGCSMNVIDGFEKMLFGSGSGDTDDLKDHGVVTGYMAAVADA
jgi:N4-gp56 family major capsid protein